MTKNVRIAGIALVMAVPTAFAAPIVDDFESYAVGSFPSAQWQDVAGVVPVSPPSLNAPIPSATVVATTNANGAATQALQTTGDLGVSKGIFAPVPQSSTYSLVADMRTLRFANSDPSFAGPASDWSTQITFAQAGVSNFAFTPQAGVYASSLTHSWRFFLAGAVSNLDEDLGVAVNLDQWYTVSFDTDVLNGVLHTIISDTASGNVLADVSKTIAGWDPTQEGQYDSIAFFGGEVAAEDPTAPGRTTIGSIAQIDNINIKTVPLPEPATLALAVFGLAFAGRFRPARVLKNPPG